MITVFTDKELKGDALKTVHIGTDYSVKVSFVALFDNYTQEVSEVLHPQPYTEYALMYSHEKANLNWIPLHALTVQSRQPFEAFFKVFGVRSLAKVITGKSIEDMIILLPTDRHNTNTAVKTNHPYKIKDDYRELSGSILFITLLWDGYALSVGNKTLRCDRQGKNIINGVVAPTDITGEYSGDVIDLAIIKHKGMDKLSQPMLAADDNEEIFIESSAGILNTRRVKLVNGKAKVKLHTLGYHGPVKIKIGIKYYLVINDYEVII